MPSLRHLLEELRKLNVDPDEIQIRGRLYDALVDQADDVVEENPDEDEED